MTSVQFDDFAVLDCIRLPLLVLLLDLNLSIFIKILVTLPLDLLDAIATRLFLRLLQI